MNLSGEQLSKITLYAKEAVESLPEDHPYIHFLGSLPYLCEDFADTRKELELNKKLLARQCDLAREAEAELESLRGKVLKYKHLFDSCNNLKEMFDSLENLFDTVEK